MIDGRLVIERNMLPEVLRQSPGIADRGIEALGEMVRGEAVFSLNEQTPGTPDIRYNPERSVMVSPPGSAPNTDTGFLASTITVQPAGFLARFIAVGAEYGEYLETGLADGSKRPFLYPALESVEPKVTEVMLAVFRSLEALG